MSEDVLHQHKRKYSRAISEVISLPLSMKGITCPSIYRSSMHHQLNSSSTHPSFPYLSATALTHLYIYPPSLVKWFNELVISSNEDKHPTHLCCCPQPKSQSERNVVMPQVQWWKSWTFENRTGMEEWGGRTGRVHVSGPIGDRGWRRHLPKQTAQRSRVLHLSLWITPLSHPPVPQCPLPHTQYSKFIQGAEGWVLWNVKLQHGSNI